MCCENRVGVACILTITFRKLRIQYDLCIEERNNEDCHCCDVSMMCALRSEYVKIVDVLCSLSQTTDI